MSGLEALLDVQSLDTTGDQLRHRRLHFPERTALRDVERRLAELVLRQADAAARRAAVAEREAELDTNVASLSHRVTEIERRMYSGEVSATRDLLAMGGEVDSLKARRNGVEEDVLGVLEQADELDGEVAALAGDHQTLEAEAAALRAAIGDAEATVDAELAEVAAHRDQTAAGVASEVLATYQKLRTQLGGVGAARLVGTSCSGCHLTLPTSEVARIKREPPGTLVFCDQCGRILVN